MSPEQERVPGGEQSSRQGSHIDLRNDEALLQSTHVTDCKLSPNTPYQCDLEGGLHTPDELLKHKTIDRLYRMREDLQKMCSESQLLCDETATLCLKDGTGHVDSFHKLEEVCFDLARVNHKLHQLVPDNRVRSLPLGSESMLSSYLLPLFKLFSRVILPLHIQSSLPLDICYPFQLTPYLDLTPIKRVFSARQYLRSFFADNMTIIIGNLFIVTLASFFLGTGVILLIHEGSFLTSTTIHHSTFSFALAECLFRLNAVHQAFIPYLRNGEGSPRVWKFFTAFIMSAAMALVALGLLFKSMALYAIFNFLGAWGLMVGVWILLENERQM
jgi:hypothetical protein